MSDKYQQLKVTLSSHLIKDKWTTMAYLMAVPVGTQEGFKSAYDLFTWMEDTDCPGTGQKYLSRTTVSNLRTLFLHSCVGAANLIHYIDDYEVAVGLRQGNYSIEASAPNRPSIEEHSTPHFNYNLKAIDQYSHGYRNEQPSIDNYSYRSSYEPPSINAYGSFKGSIGRQLTSEQLLNMARLLKMSVVEIEKINGHPEDIFTCMEHCGYIKDDNVTELALLLMKPVIGANDLADEVMKFQQEHGSNRQVKEIPAEPYIEMKLELSQWLTRDQMKAMFPIVKVPGGKQDDIKDAYEIFQWMERRLQLTENKLDELKALLNNPTVGAANLVQIIEKYEAEKNGGRVNSRPSVVQVQIVQSQALQPVVVQPQVAQPAVVPANESELTKCKVCFERDVNTVFHPCGHACCDVCTSTLQICPHCRGPIAKSTRVYLFT